MPREYYKLPILIVLSGVIASFAQAAQAADGTTNEALLAQVVRGCEFGDFPNYYSEITTNSGDPLRVRSAPAGEPIGLIPDGWQVVVLEWSRNGVWARVTSHFGSGPRFGTAPDFREGWVSAAYLKDLGRFCEKPINAAQLLQPEVFGEQPVEVQGDWLALGDSLGDSLAETAP